MKLAHPLRFILVTVLGLALSIALAVQSAGIALGQKAPDTAASLFPLNGLAQEKLATLLYLSAGSEAKAEEIDGRGAEDWARLSYRHEPLTPSSHVVLAFSENDPDTRSQIVKLASQLDRRETRLQGLVLRDQVAAQDYPGAVNTLDRILRVRPSRAEELFPSLLAVFTQEGAVQEFARILDGSSPWHQSFFEYAVRQKAALPNLLKLRRQMSFNDEELDQTLLKNLVLAGSIEPAYQFYLTMPRAESGNSGAGRLTWDSTLVPFEWKFADEGGLRAQPSRQGDMLEIRARPGNGGIVATRVIKAPPAPFRLVVNHKVSPAGVARDIDIAMRCMGDKVPLFSVDLVNLGAGQRVTALPPSCEFLELMIAARAWSGRASLSAEIDQIRIEG